MPSPHAYHRHWRRLANADALDEPLSASEVASALMHGDGEGLAAAAFDSALVGEHPGIPDSPHRAVRVIELDDPWSTRWRITIEQDNPS